MCVSLAVTSGVGSYPAFSPKMTQCQENPHSVMSNEDSFILPPFRPHPLLRGGHRQTLAAYAFKGEQRRYSATRHTIELPDGDRLILHDDCPANWGPGAPFVLLLHGLAGCHGSFYMIRVGGKLVDRGVRVFRLDHRGCGSGAKLARLPYHAGRSDDVRAACDCAAGLCNGSLGGVVGFSLSGNMLLKMLGEDGRSNRVPPYLACAAAVNPPIDLEQCGDALRKRSNRYYDRHFTGLLAQQVQERIDQVVDAPGPVGGSIPARLREIDDKYTAPVSGFDGVYDYYANCSGAQFVPAINVPTLILTARDDPLIPVMSFEQLPAVPAVQVHIEEHGGHLGYIARPGIDPDRRWMDWRVVEWLAAHLRFGVART